MVSEQGNNKTLDTGTGEAQTETEAATAAIVEIAAFVDAATMEKLLHPIHRMSVVTLRPPSEQSTQPTSGMPLTRRKYSPARCHCQHVCPHTAAKCLHEPAYFLPSVIPSPVAIPF